MTKKPNASCLRLLLGMTGLLITSSNGRTLKNQTEALPKNRTLEGVAHAPRAPCRVLRAMSALGHFREIGTLGREPREKVTILRKKFSAARGPRSAFRPSNASPQFRSRRRTESPCPGA